MPRLPRITAAQAIRVLEKVGFVLDRQKGSHRIFTNGLGRWVTVPFHAGKILRPKLFKSIVAAAGLEVEEFRQLL